MPLEGQAKLLRVIQDGEFDRLGDERPTRVDVRIVAATNADLAAAVAAGRFRSDLFYRLNVVRIEVPPLRDRPEDIPVLAAHFVAEIAGRLGRPAPELSAVVLDRLRAYAWPGNVRELRNAIERALILSPPGRLDALEVAADAAGPGALEGEPPGELNLRTALTRLERDVVKEAVRRSGGVRKEAARLLGIDARNLGYYLRKHHLDADAISE
jgi:two-component system response regulator HydG